MNKAILPFVIYLGYFVIGIVSFIISPTLPLIIKDFGISTAIAGSIFTAASLGGFIGALGGGVLSDLFGRKFLVILGCLFQIIGFGLIALSRSWALILILFFLTSLGRGFLSISFNTIISDINPDRRGAALNTLHGIYGIGNLLGPMLAGVVLSLNYDWRVIYYGAAAIWLVFLVINMPIKYPSVSMAEDGIKDKRSKRPFSELVSTNSILPMLFMVSFIYNGVATGLIGWINTYLDGMDFHVLLGAGMVSVFYLGLTLGRFICRSLSEQMGYSKTILLCALGSLAFYPFAIYNTKSIFITIGIFLSGLFLSGLHPTALAYANSQFPVMSGTVTSLLSIAMSLGSMSLPWLIGLVADIKNFKVGFSIGYVSIAILVVISILLIRHEKELRS